jgi:uncharacterized protein (DUF2235 family)
MDDVNQEHRSADAAPEPLITDSKGRISSPLEEANPKRLVIFCDGTWNDLRMKHLTNVARLAKCVQPMGIMRLGDTHKTVAQVVYYDDGVGVSEGVSKLGDAIVRLLGGALGRGLDAKIEKAYRFIVLNYNPGDEIFIFGFSRGAYTARSLCGLIRDAGVIRRAEFQRVPEAIALYRNGKPPWDGEAQAFRRNYSHPVIAGPEDYTDDDLKLIEAFKAEGKGRDKISETVHVIPPTIRQRGFHVKYLGLWDTVGSMGVPTRFKWLYRLTHRRYLFHDESVSSMVESARHAVALDEERASFDVSSIANIHELNILWAAARRDAQVDFADQPQFVPYCERPYQQRWFPGDHGAVGGGNAEPGLSSAALLWIAEGAEKAGMHLDPIKNDELAGLKLDRSAGSELTEAKHLAQPCANWKINKDGSPRPPGQKDLLGQVGGYKRRYGPKTIDAVHESARERWRRDPTYRPPGMIAFQGCPELQPPQPP